MIDKLDQALQFHQTALTLRAQRQQVLASNVANADTPNYKARDFDFGSALKNALGGAGKPASAVAAPGLLRTAAAHLPLTTAVMTGASAGNTASGIPLQYRNASQPSLDNNTVDMDVERNQFADNALRYEASVTMISGQIKNLMAAIQG